LTIIERGVSLTVILCTGCVLAGSPIGFPGRLLHERGPWPRPLQLVQQNLELIQLDNPCAEPGCRGAVHSAVADRLMLLREA